MCAAMIHHVGDGAISVIYGQEDNSEDATGTDLDKGSKQWLLKESINILFAHSCGQSKKPQSKFFAREFWPQPY
jgi:hypothetical protein